MTTQMTPYDASAWAETEEWRHGRLSASGRRLVPGQIRAWFASGGRVAKEKFASLPGAAEFEAIFLKTLDGLMDLGSRAAMASVRDGAIIEAFKRRGHDVEDIEDIKRLELRDVDKVKPNLALAYTSASTLEGAAAGFAISGGEAMAAAGTVLGVGAGGAPGVGTVVGVMAADAAAVLVAANRAVAHTAAYYGYDLNKPDERLFALAVLSMGTAAETGKAAAYIELNKLVQMLARRATWNQLRQSTVTRVIEKVFTRLGIIITQRKLGQAVPLIGGLIGAGMNARLLLSVVDDADMIYRERFLRERYGVAVAPVSGTPADEAEVIHIAEILEEEFDGDPPSASA